MTLHIEGLRGSTGPSVLLAGFKETEPRSQVARDLRDRLAKSLGTEERDVVAIHYRETSADLTRWIGDELIRQGVVKDFSTNRLKPRKRGE